MYLICPTGSLYQAVGAASAAFADMAAGKLYLFTTSADCFIKQSASAPTAAAAADNALVKAGQSVLIHSSNGVKTAVIQASAGGFATLVPVTVVR